MRSKNIIRIVLITALLLLVPLVAMQFSDEVDWNLFDFVVMGALLLTTGFAYELATRKVTDNKEKIAIGIGVAIVFLLVWAELAVGVFGTPFAGS